MPDKRSIESAPATHELLALLEGPTAIAFVEADGEPFFHVHREWRDSPGGVV